MNTGLATGTTHVTDVLQEQINLAGNAISETSREIVILETEIHERFERLNALRRCRDELKRDEQALLTALDVRNKANWNV